MIDSGLSHLSGRTALPSSLYESVPGSNSLVNPKSAILILRAGPTAGTTTLHDSYRREIGV